MGTATLTLQCAASITVDHVIDGACSLLNRSRNLLAQTKAAACGVAAAITAMATAAAGSDQA
jgi:hypothetical protein